MSAPQIENIMYQLQRHDQNANRWLRRRLLSAITKLIIHWNGPATGSDELRQLKGDASYHISKNWASAGNPPAYGWAIMYHFAVGQSGKVYALNPLTDILWHVSNGNPVAIGIICLIGEGQKPTPAMFASLRQLVDWLVDERVDLPNLSRGDVFGHGECGGVYGGGPNYGNSTECPGPDLLAWVRECRARLVPPAPERRTFAETGKTVRGEIFKYFTAEGGIGEFGFPVTEEYEEFLEDGLEYTVQLFQKALLHYRPEKGVGRANIGTMYGKLMGLVA